MADFAVILAAAGKSSRYLAHNTQTLKKVFAELCGEPVWLHAARQFRACPRVSQLIVVLSPEDEAWFHQRYASQIRSFNLQIVLGGEHRADSVQQGLQRVHAEFVAVHDAARACIQQAEIEAVFAMAQEGGAAILATQCAATVKRVEQARIVETVPRADLWLAQTPQVFRTALLREAYESHPNPSQATDEASLLEAMGRPVKIVAGCSTNLKITTQEDLGIAAAILAGRR